MWPALLWLVIHHLWARVINFQAIHQTLKSVISIRYWSSVMADCKTYTGREMVARHVQVSPPSSASTTRIVPSKHPVARAKAALSIAAWGSNWPSLAQTNTTSFSIHGTKYQTSASTPFLASTPISKTHSLVNTTRYSSFLINDQNLLHDLIFTLFPRFHWVYA